MQNLASLFLLTVAVFVISANLATLADGSNFCAMLDATVKNPSQYPSGKICANNRETYDNVKMMRMMACYNGESLFPIYGGECVSRDFSACLATPGRCNMQTPVCSNQRKWYANLCELLEDSCKFPKLKIGFVKEISANDPKSYCSDAPYCPPTVSKVCGSDQKTYDNECHVRLEMFNTGELLSVIADSQCPS